MPLREYVCVDCKYKTVELIRGDYPKVIECPECKAEGHVATAIYKISMPAKTAGSWGDNTGKYGVNGYYDKALGATYYNTAERDAICKAKGLVPLSQIGEDYCNKVVDKTRKEIARAEADTVALETAMIKYDGDKEKAIVEAFPAKLMLERANETTD